MRTVRTIAEVREALRGSGSIGLVPTMGAFHAGHLALFAAARAENDVVVASLFVNPAQFGPGEDFERYPRDEGRDGQLAEEAGLDMLFEPLAEELYPDGYQTWVDVEELSRTLEGEYRPGHFRGVATICLKLFNIVRPQRAYFGQKDAQQAAVVKRLVADLNLELEIRVVPTVRDADGLALSSRNAYLSPEERKEALALPLALEAGRHAFVTGSDPATEAKRLLHKLDVDYVEAADLDGQRVLAAAVRVGDTRLIDNVVLEVPCQASARLGRTRGGEER
jgi:pantoate--beta-alanine ligase